MFVFFFSIWPMTSMLLGPRQRRYRRKVPRGLHDITDVRKRIIRLDKYYDNGSSSDFALFRMRLLPSCSRLRMCLAIRRIHRTFLESYNSISTSPLDFVPSRSAGTAPTFGISPLYPLLESAGVNRALKRGTVITVTREECPASIKAIRPSYSGSVYFH